jgi:hypothetical protein
VDAGAVVEPESAILHNHVRSGAGVLDVQSVAAAILKQGVLDTKVGAAGADHVASGAAVAKYGISQAIV